MTNTSCPSTAHEHLEQGSCSTASCLGQLGGGVSGASLISVRCVVGCVGDQMDDRCNDRPGRNNKWGVYFAHKEYAATRADAVANRVRMRYSPA